MEHELWFTELLNNHAAGVANAVLGLAGVHAHNPGRPWENFIAMQILVALAIVIVFAAAAAAERREAGEVPARLRGAVRVPE